MTKTQKQSRYNIVYKPECIVCNKPIESPKDKIYKCIECKNIDNIKTKVDAVQYAIDVQTLMSEKDLSYSELVEYTAILEKLAKKFHLIREFKENGLI